MKVIFLDVDGVLNSDNTNYRKCHTPDGYRGIEDKYVKLLKKIVEQTNAIIVLTSDWKEGWEPRKDNCTPDGKYLINKLAKEHLKITTKTNDHSHGRGYIGRGKGIKNYLAEHDVESYVVLDDNYFYDFDDEIMNHFVNTVELYGLTEEDVLDAIKILNRKDTNHE